MKKIFYIFLIFICSCETKKNDLFNLFSDKIEAIPDYEILDVEQYNILDINNFDKDENYYVITHPKDSLIITLVDIQTNKFLKGLKIGRGPNELLSAMLIGVDNGIVYINDVTTERLCAIDIKKCFELNIITFTIIESPHKFIGASVSNNYIIGNMHYDSDPISRLTLYNRQNGVSSYYNDFPQYMEGMTSTQKHMLSINLHTKQHPDNYYFILHNFSVGELSIWKLDNDKIKLHKDFIFHAPEFYLDNQYVRYKKENKLGFKSVCVSRDHIYCSYIGMPYEKYKRNPENLKHLFIFDWNGTPVKQYTLPLSIRVSCYDSKENAIYGLNDEGETKIIKYKLPPLS